MTRYTAFEMASFGLAVAWVVAIASLEIVSFTTVEAWGEASANQTDAVELSADMEKMHTSRGMKAWAVGSIVTIFVSVATLGLGLVAHAASHGPKVTDAFFCISGGTAVASTLFTIIEFTTAFQKTRLGLSVAGSTDITGTTTTSWCEDFVAVGVALIFLKIMHVYVFVSQMGDRAVHAHVKLRNDDRI
jgi:hypothetical protein